MVQGTTPAHKGLAPSRLIPYLRYDKDAHAGHTHCVHAWPYRPHERLVIVQRILLGLTFKRTYRFCFNIFIC